jgi:3-oxoacyl-(acyl-carrier-protein) synthase
VHPYELAASVPRRGDYRYAVSSSFGFGGHNIVLAFGSY